MRVDTKGGQSVVATVERLGNNSGLKMGMLMENLRGSNLVLLMVEMLVVQMG